jgi:hypothetical protein
MDTAMRDLERIEERSANEGRGVLVLSGVGLIAALGIVVAAVAALPGDSESQPAEDPLQMLAFAEEVDAQKETAKPVKNLKLDPETLSFPTTLITDTRPEVAVAVAAATAELQHLDPVTSAPPRSDIAAGLPAAAMARSSRWPRSATHSLQRQSPRRPSQRPQAMKAGTHSR